MKNITILSQQINKTLKKHNNNAEATQGVDLDATPDLDTVLKWLSDDLGRARALLQAIHDNPDIKLRVAEHMLGQLNNYKASKKAQQENPI